MIDTNKWIKIDNNLYYVTDISVQTTLGSHALLEISFDIKQYPDYKLQLVSYYDKKCAFSIENNAFYAKGSVIKQMYIFGDKINLTLRSDLIFFNKSERRDEIIEDILNNKLQN